MAKKHKLTKKTDHIDGFSGRDLFLAPMFEAKGHERATLSNKDVLNGRGGIDTINAFISADALTPRLKNIEKAVFTRHETSDLALDLARAGKLSSVQLNSFDADVNISHAGKLANFTVKNSIGHPMTIDGINAAKVEAMNLNFINAGFDDAGEFLVSKITGDGDFKQMNIKLKDSAVDLTNGHGAEKLVIHSLAGAGDNHLYALTAPAADITKSIVIDGDGNLEFYRKDTGYDVLVSETLESFNASAMTGDLDVEIAGKNLASVKTGSGSDAIYLYGFDGTGISVDLGAGNDYIRFTNAFLASGDHFIDGGDGVDIARITGALADPGSILKNFEKLYIYFATGAYNFTGSDLSSISIYSWADAVVLDGVASGSYLTLYNGSTESTTVKVNNAAVSTADELDLHLRGGVFGNAFNGFTALGLSHLNIESKGSANTFYLGQLGAVADPVKITITGDQHLNLLAAASNIHIGELTIDNAAGVDLSALKSIQNVFLSTGATITGGAGDDVLVGGSGNDTISTGGGNDVLWASLGHDVFDFGGTGNDVLHYTAATQSNSSKEDWIQNFGDGDKLDLSALAADIGFVGAFKTAAEAEAQYAGNGKINVFFNETNHRLYVDLDNNHQVSSGDLQIYIPDIDTFSSAYLL